MARVARGWTPTGGRQRTPARGHGPPARAVLSSPTPTTPPPGRTDGAVLQAFLRACKSGAPPNHLAVLHEVGVDLRQGRGRATHLSSGQLAPPPARLPAPAAPAALACAAAARSYHGQPRGSAALPLACRRSRRQVKRSSGEQQRCRRQGAGDSCTGGGGGGAGSGGGKRARTRLTLAAQGDVGEAALQQLPPRRALQAVGGADARTWSDGGTQMAARTRRAGRPLHPTCAACA